MSRDEPPPAARPRADVPSRRVPRLSPCPRSGQCIQNVYRDLRLRRKSPHEYMGILCNLILRDKLPLDDIRASVTEMMAGGVDTTSMTLQWAMLELARAPGVQEQLRAEVLAAKRETGGDREKMLRSTRLLKAAIKETLRLHPVAVTLQRYTTHEVILHDYRIPPRILENFKIETMRAVEIGTKFDLILIPDKPIQLTLRPLECPA
ncbi:hypothetical protein DUI87_29352 [Hirundo rustica rustica]|uniref:Cholesterol side-chain cleavage enzyme, mitochondrial n=1 Tax=Hirundo rustica rustica TaxID=333673 RepID=A0A3M0J2J6_HIRRU|nr:hypothetical protein DUI87_29352 [Hirundo rustica rustica]